MRELDYEHFRSNVNADELCTLEKIFVRASFNDLSDETRRELQQQLADALHDLVKAHSGSLYPSPDGDKYILTIYGDCYFISLHNLIFLFFDSFLYEGDVMLTEFKWMDADHLVVFERRPVVVGSPVRECICHYPNDDSAFAYLANPAENELKRAQPDLLGSAVPPEDSPQIVIDADPDWL